MTSELRELVCLPIASSASRITTSRPAVANARATARPTTPAPITAASTLSMEEVALELGLDEQLELTADSLADALGEGGDAQLERRGRRGLGRHPAILTARREG